MSEWNPYELARPVDDPLAVPPNTLSEVGLDVSPAFPDEPALDLDSLQALSERLAAHAQHMTRVAAGYRQQGDPVAELLDQAAREN